MSPLVGLSSHPIGVVRGVPQSKTSPIHQIRKDVPPYRDPPPPYRSPPPPTSGNMKQTTNINQPIRNMQMSPININLSNQENTQISTEAVAYNQQYRELVSLVNFQREKLSNQQADLTKVRN
jgi:Ras association domain-containing protein 7/8